MVEATEFLYRLGFPEPEAMTEEESWEPHPPSCVCHRILEQQLASDCRFGAPVLVAERRNGKVVGWRVSWDDSEHLLLRFGLQKGDLVTGIDGQKFDLFESQEAVRRGLLSEHRLEFEIERDGRPQTLQATLLDSGKIDIGVTTALVHLLDHPGEFLVGFSAKPFVANGEVAGLHLSLSNIDHPLYKLGLRDQDILLSLNGTVIDGSESLATMYRILRETNQLEFKILRDGHVQIVNSPLED